MNETKMAGKCKCLWLLIKIKKESVWIFVQKVSFSFTVKELWHKTRRTWVFNWPMVGLAESGSRTWRQWVLLPNWHIITASLSFTKLFPYLFKSEHKENMSDWNAYFRSSIPDKHILPVLRNICCSWLTNAVTQNENQMYIKVQVELCAVLN